MKTQVRKMIVYLCNAPPSSVIPSPEGAWESPVIQMLSVVITGDCHGLQASLAMTVVFDAWPHKRSFISQNFQQQQQIFPGRRFQGLQHRHPLPGLPGTGLDKPQFLPDAPGQGVLLPACGRQGRDPAVSSSQPVQPQQARCLLSGISFQPGKGGPVFRLSGKPGIFCCRSQPMGDEGGKFLRENLPRTPMHPLPDPLLQFCIQFHIQSSQIILIPVYFAGAEILLRKGDFQKMPFSFSFKCAII